MNRLKGAKSAYLRQHADNPVHWWPWGLAAFEEAAERDVPVFVSIGYAACHWCHVMEHESFADEATAAALNARFVCVKVDREEHPEVDAFAMEVLLTLTGDAGWPASLFLAPDKTPLHGGTYFPKYPRYGVSAFRDVLQRVSDAWTGRSRDGWLRRGREALDSVNEKEAAETRDQLPSPRLVGEGLLALASSADPRSGGWGHGVKFPHPPRLMLLLEEGRDAGARQVAEAALEAMERGGLHDQLGGGFHRYCVDEDWQVPHFEKMLADNAQLAVVYTEAWRRFGTPLCLRTAGQTLAWMEADLLLGEDLLASSLDADDPGGEGAYYTWTPGELAGAVGARAAQAAACLGVAEGGNLDSGRSVLHRKGDPSLLAALRRPLLAVRQRRPPPARDDKVVRAWNGLALSAFALSARRCGHVAHLARAQALASALLAAAPTRVVGNPGAPASLDDRAALVQGLLDLHAADGNLRWLLAASDEGKALMAAHQEPETGALLAAPVGEAPLPWVRSPVRDGAEPAAVGLALLALQRLLVLGDRALDPAAVQRALVAACARLEEDPGARPTVLRALARHHRPPTTVVITGPPGAAWQALLSATRSADSTVAVAARWVPESEESAARFAVFDNRGHPQRAQAWLCEGTSCRLPLSDPEAVRDALN